MSAKRGPGVGRVLFHRGIERRIELDLRGERRQDQERPRPAVLPQADGPLVDVTLPDGQHSYAVVKARVREPDGR
jgi:hypothetical protein